MNPEVQQHGNVHQSSIGVVQEHPQCDTAVCTHTVTPVQASSRRQHKYLNCTVNTDSFSMSSIFLNRFKLRQQTEYRYSFITGVLHDAVLELKGALHLRHTTLHHTLSRHSSKATAFSTNGRAFPAPIFVKITAINSIVCRSVTLADNKCGKVRTELQCGDSPETSVHVNFCQNTVYRILHTYLLTYSMEQSPS